jgi:hypothetical protein
MGNADARSLLAFVGGTLFLVVGGMWLASTMDRAGNTRAGQTSFQAVQPIAEGVERVCPTCQGSRRAACDECGGSGRAFYYNTGMMVQGTCTKCGRSGVGECYRCKGTGKISSAQPGVLKWGGGKRP